MLSAWVKLNRSFSGCCGWRRIRLAQNVAALEAAVVAKSKFVDVALQVFPADAVVRPVNRPFQLSPESFDGVRVDAANDAPTLSPRLHAWILQRGRSRRTKTSSSFRSCGKSCQRSGKANVVCVSGAEYEVQTCRVIRELPVKILVVVAHFLAFDFRSRANAPSCVISTGSVLACSHSQYVRSGIDSRAAASDCVSLRRSRSDLSCAAKLLICALTDRQIQPHSVTGTDMIITVTRPRFLSTRFSNSIFPRANAFVERVETAVAEIGVARIRDATIVHHVVIPILANSHRVAKCGGCLFRVSIADSVGHIFFLWRAYWAALITMTESQILRTESTII